MEKQDRMKILNDLREVIKKQYPKLEISTNRPDLMNDIMIQGFQHNMIAGHVLEEFRELAIEAGLYSFVSITRGELHYTIH